jgi:hypothetical protein
VWRAEIFRNVGEEHEHLQPLVLVRRRRHQHRLVEIVAMQILVVVGGAELILEEVLDALMLRLLDRHGLRRWLLLTCCSSFEAREIQVYDGAVILESLRVGTSLEDIPLVVRKLSRYTVTGTTADQPSVWTILEFEVDDNYTVALAEALKGVLDKPGWYADFHNEREIFVVFPGRVFRYPRGDKASRSEAQAYGRKLGVPEPQLDWAD